MNLARHPLFLAATSCFLGVLSLVAVLRDQHKRWAFAGAVPG